MFCLSTYPLFIVSNIKKGKTGRYKYDLLEDKCIATNTQNTAATMVLIRLQLTANYFVSIVLVH